MEVIVKKPLVTIIEMVSITTVSSKTTERAIKRLQDVGWSKRTEYAQRSMSCAEMK